MPLKTPSALQLVDLMRLVESEGSDLDAIIKAAFEWEHTRRLEVAKWLLATGAAAVIAVFTLLARETPPANWVLIVLAGAGSVAATFGLAALRRAGVVHSRYVQTSILCARLGSVRPFLSRLRQEGEL
jgi:hypothetical protein